MLTQNRLLPAALSCQTKTLLAKAALKEALCCQSKLASPVNRSNYDNKGWLLSKDSTQRFGICDGKILAFRHADTEVN